MKPERLNQRVAAEDEAYEKALDHLVDTKGYSYADARLELGDPPYEMYSVEQADRGLPLGRYASERVVRHRRRSGQGPQYGEEEGVGYENGLPHYYQPWTPLNAEQATRNRRWIERIRKAGGHPSGPEHIDGDEPDGLDA